MGLLDKFEKLGLKLANNTGEKLIFHVPEEVQKLHGLQSVIEIPRSTLGAEGYGKVIQKVEGGPSTANQLLEKYKEPTPTALKPTKMEQYLKDPKAMAGVAGGLAFDPSKIPQTDMNPLPMLKQGYDAYKSGLSKVQGALANQLDMTPDKSATEDLKTGLSIAADPTNFIPGVGGVAATGIDAMLSQIPENKLNKTRAMLGSN